MSLRKSLFAVAMIFAVLFTMTSGVSAAEKDANPLDVDFATDQSNYDYEDEVTSTITVTNKSDRYSSSNVKVQTELPDDFEIINDEDVNIEDGKVIWDMDELDRGKSKELTLQTKLKQSVLSDMENKTKQDDEENQLGVTGLDNGDSDKGSDQAGIANEDQEAPQTGDTTNLMKYVMIMIISVAAGLFAIMAIRKRRVATKLSTFLLAFFVLLPSLSIVHAEDVTTQTLEKSHQLTIGDRDYDIKTTVTADVHDNQEKIPVTGTAYDENGNLLTNETLTFSTTIDEEQVEENVETDDDGYFVARLVRDAAYTTTGSQLVATVTANEVNDIQVEEETGEIELGKTLANGDNKSSLQPSAIYLSEEEASEINDISDDLSQATIDGSVDIQPDDLIVVPEWEDYPEGIAFHVESIEAQDGDRALQLDEPELEEIFEEIIGDLDTDMSPDKFVPADGVTIEDEAAPFQSDGDSALNALQTPLDASLGGKVTINLDNLYSVDGFSFDGSIDLSGQVTGNIDWRWGINPVETFDFNYQGEQTINGELSSEVKTDLPDVPLGKFVVPTEIPGLAVSVPFDLVTEVSGEVGVEVSTGLREEFGIGYENGEGIRTYPEENFIPTFHVSDVNGTGKASTGVQMSVLAQALGIDMAGAAATGGFEGTLTSPILGDSDLFECVSLGAAFNGKLELSAPIADWKSDGNIGFTKDLASTEFGDCIRSIQVDPDEIDISPGETKSVTVSGSDNENKAPINDAEPLDFIVSDSDSVKVEKDATKVDIKATESAQDGDTIDVEAVYEWGDTKVTDTLTVNIIDDREKGELVGKVIDAIDEDAIHEADVNIYDGDRVVSELQTDEEGTYKTNLAPGDYKVEVSHDGYITDTSNVTITSEDTTTYDSKLQLVDEEHSGNGIASGMITDAVTGQAVDDVNIEIRKGKNNTSGEIIETLTTDENGHYEVELPGGNYTMALSADGYISTHTNILTIGGKEKTEQNATISPDGVSDDNFRVVLTWGEEPWDLDSHFTGPTADGDGERFHVYWWDQYYKDDANDVNLDRDDVSSYGPETVTVIEKIQSGTYTYAVHNYTGRNLNEDNQYDLSHSDAKVQVYQENTLLQEFNVPVDQIGNSWRVFEIRDGDIVPINEMETIDDYRSADSFAPMD